MGIDELTDGTRQMIGEFMVDQVNKALDEGLIAEGKLIPFVRWLGAFARDSHLDTNKRLRAISSRLVATG